jgi:hypothetical protein
MLKELKKIEGILDWHPDFDIQRMIKQVKLRRNLTYILLVLLLMVSVAFNFTTMYKNGKIDSLKENIFSLENNLWSNNTIKDSLMNTIESSGYLTYLIESESKIDIPSNTNKEHLKYMFERAIDKKIPISIMFRLVHHESRFDSTAVSSTGAFGYMQLLQSSYKRYCDRLNMEYYPVTSKKNIYIGTEFLSNMYDYWSKKKPKESPEIIWNYALATYAIGIANINDTTFQRRDVTAYLNFVNKRF